ncbi:MAG: ABC transporter substrate-binding protein [Pseudolabrys sp.]
MSKKQPSKLLLAALLAAAVAAIASSQARAQTGNVRVAITSKSLIYAPLYVGIRTGMFEQRGLKVEVFDGGSGTKVAAGLAGGSLTAALMAIDHVFAGTTREQKWVMFGQLMNKEPYSFAMRKDVAEAKGITAASPTADRLKALEGTTIAVSTLGSGTHLALASAMTTVGLAPDKAAKWVPIGDPMAIVSALERKQVDVAGRAPGPRRNAGRSWRWHYAGRLFQGSNRRALSDHRGGDHRCPAQEPRRRPAQADAWLARCHQFHARTSGGSRQGDPRGFQVHGREGLQGRLRIRAALAAA